MQAIENGPTTNNLHVEDVPKTTSWGGVWNSLRLPSVETTLCLGALLFSGCSAETPITTGQQSVGYIDKGHGVFMIDSTKLGGDINLVATAFAEWKRDHPAVRLREVIRLGTYDSHGAILLLTDTFFSTNLPPQSR